MGQATYSYGGRCELWGRLPIPMVGSELWGWLPIPMGQATYSYGGELTMGQAFFLPVKKAISCYVRGQGYFYYFLILSGFFHFIEFLGRIFL